MSVLIYFGVESLGYSLSTVKFIQMISFAIFFQIPACIVQDIRPLHILSIVGIGFLFYLIFVSLPILIKVSMLEIQYYQEINYSKSSVVYFDVNLNIFSVICMYFFCFSNHNVVLTIISDLKGDVEKKGNRVINIQFIIEFFCYLLVMFIGYLSTFENTNEIYIDRPNEGQSILLGKTLYIVGLTCDIGLYYYISRPQLEYFFYKNLTDNFNKKRYFDS